MLFNIFAKHLGNKSPYTYKIVFERAFEYITTESEKASTFKLMNI
jgi:hypothetical protein